MIEFRKFVNTDEDLNKIIFFITQLAIYEKEPDAVKATVDSLRKWIFENKIAHGFFIVEDGKEIGFCLYFLNFSTWVGKAGLYIEDLFILPEYRGKGYGKAVFDEVKSIAKKEGLGRIEWICLDWNEPSIKFYKSMGAKPLDEWTVYRLDEGTY